MEGSQLRGHLHLIEKKDHLFALRDGSGLWASGYWKLSESERGLVRKLFLHRTKSTASHWGGDVVRVVPAIEYAEMAAKHDTQPDDRWVLIVQPTVAGKGTAWEGDDWSMAYKSFV
jgi:hypothetical protein